MPERHIVGLVSFCGKSRVKFIEAKYEKLLSLAQLSLSSLKCDVGNYYMNIMLK
jgi:hypothetical protein